ncbi:MAG: glutathione-disulfide reductase [Spirulinaceae cyanobacterium SM2_1_0]|nr:glutathione-disulfide reductase [Spirulinaceae cyanobacterium SM2_1_0]
MSYDYDLFVIGAGSGGIATARRAAEYGAKVGVAEYGRLGGTCVNRGCVPKKLMVYASHFGEQFEEAGGYGWHVGDRQFNWSKLITAVNDEVTRLNGIYQRMLDQSRVEVIPARARFLDSHTLDVGDRKVTAERILIAVGGRPVKPTNISGIDYTITSDDIFHLPEQPQRAVIIGGGYIGCEFACILNGLGTEVTQIIRGDRVLRGFDDDLRNEIQAAMQAHGIRLYTGIRNLSITKTEYGLEVKAHGDCDTDVVVDAVGLAATGRRPNLDNLGIENTQVEIQAGAIAVNERSQTAEPHIYAVGDCTDRVNLTPVAIAEGRALADTIFGGKSVQMAYDNIPTAIFTTPEAATVGLTEEEARELYGDALKVYRSKFRAMYYTLPDKQEKTLMKLLVDTNTDKVVGAHMVGDHAAEIIQGVAIAIKSGATKTNFDDTVGIHPSSAEEFVTMR